MRLASLHGVRPHLPRNWFGFPMANKGSMSGQSVNLKDQIVALANRLCPFRLPIRSRTTPADHVTPQESTLVTVGLLIPILLVVPLLSSRRRGGHTSLRVVQILTLSANRSSHPPCLFAQGFAVVLIFTAIGDCWTSVGRRAWPGGKNLVPNLDSEESHDAKVNSRQ